MDDDMSKKRFDLECKMNKAFVEMSHCYDVIDALGECRAKVRSEDDAISELMDVAMKRAYHNLAKTANDFTIAYYDLDTLDDED